MSLKNPFLNGLQEEMRMRIQSEKNHVSLQIDLVLNKRIMALAEKLTHENVEASISQGVIVSMLYRIKKEVYE